METINKTVGKTTYELVDFGGRGVNVYRLSNKARLGRVPVAYVRREDLNLFLLRLAEKEKSKEDYKVNKKKEDKERREKAINDIQIGDLMHDSRGYDMTHNDFLQVVDKKGSKVFCRYIGRECVSGDDGFTGEEKPVKDAFVDEGRWYVISKWGYIKLNEYRHARKSEWDRSYYFNYLD